MAGERIPIIFEMIFKGLREGNAQMDILNRKTMNESSQGDDYPLLNARSNLQSNESRICESLSLKYDFMIGTMVSERDGKF